MNHGKEKETRKGWRLLSGTILMFVMCCHLAGCSPRVMTQVEYRDRIEYRDRVERDTVFESVHEKEYVKGDTVHVEQVRYVYKEMTRTDTTIVTLTDSVPYPVEVVRYVEKPLKRWQSGMIAVGFMAITLLIVAVVVKMRK